MATTADVVVSFLAASGVRRIYGVPGEGSSLDLIEAVRARHIQFVPAQQAGAAAIMAATDGDLTGKPGVCLTAAGSGAAGAVGGVRHAYLDRLPLIVLSGCHARETQRLGWRQYVENRRILHAVTKESATITHARAERMMAWAWGEAMDVPPGPVHLDLPADEAVHSARRRALVARESPREGPSPSAIRKIARLLTRRGRAVIVAGLGCRDNEIAAPLRELVEHLGVPTLTTPRAKGVLPEDHPLAAGVFFGGRLEEELLDRADCVLAIGLDPTEILPRTRRARSAILSMAEYRSTPCPLDLAAEAVGDLVQGLAILRENLPPAGEWNLAAWGRRGESFRHRARTLLAEACRPHGRGLAPHRVVEIAREIFPRTTLATAGAGAHAIAVAAFWEAYRPKTFLCSAHLGGSGYALPAAIAAKLEAPSRPVLAFMGDNGFLLNLPEMATASRLESPLVLVVFVDDSLSLPRVAQEQKRYAPLGVSLGSMDIPKIAEGLGVLGTMVEDEDGLRAALSDALNTTKPAIIGTRVNPQGYRRMLETLRGKGER
ncbi:MAG: ilvB 2 [candidate division NC10 bacterium]|nr:ilvB 2 [candidate division NC10 bacterium]